MPKTFPLDRRTFLQLTAAAGAGCGAAGCGGRPESAWRFFTEAEAAVIDAVCERIIPADSDPGASWARVVVYIDRKLAGFFSDLQPLYRDGVRAIEEVSRRDFGGSFPGLTPEQQDEVLRRMEKDEAQRAFFRTVVEQTEQGFYGDPRHGGNRDHASWRMLGVPHPPLRARRPAVRPV